MRTSEKFAMLSDASQRECRSTFSACKASGDCAPDEWDRIVNYYYENENAVPNGWFCWWE